MLTCARSPDNLLPLRHGTTAHGTPFSYFLQGTIPVQQPNTGISGTGWSCCIRVGTLAALPRVANLHIAATRPERRTEGANATRAVTATVEYQDLLKISKIDAD